MKIRASGVQIGRHQIGDGVDVPLVVTQHQMKGHENTDHQLKRLAKRDGAVTIRELGHDTAWAWVAQSLGHPKCASAPELLQAIDFNAISHAPGVWTPQQ